MRAKLIRADMQPAPGANPDDLVERDGKKYFRVGTIIDGPRAHRLVQMGVAVPDDDECRARCGLTEAQMSRAQKHYPAVNAGIHPEDYEAFFAGRMQGYNPDGSWIPGPNWVPDDEDETDEDGEE